MFWVSKNQVSMKKWVNIFTFAYGQGRGGWPPPLMVSVTVKYPFFYPYLMDEFIPCKLKGVERVSDWRHPINLRLLNERVPALLITRHNGMVMEGMHFLSMSLGNPVVCQFWSLPDRTTIAYNCFKVLRCVLKEPDPFELFLLCYFFAFTSHHCCFSPL